jgi:Zn-dependent membrane protease YugP
MTSVPTPPQYVTGSHFRVKAQIRSSNGGTIAKYAIRLLSTGGLYIVEWSTTSGTYVDKVADIDTRVPGEVVAFLGSSMGLSDIAYIRNIAICCDDVAASFAW